MDTTLGRPTLAFALLLLGASACGGKPPGLQLTTAEILEGSSQTVALVSPGKEPRQALRLRPQAGAEQRLDVALRWDASPDVRTGLRTLSAEVGISVVSVAPDGDITARLRVWSPTLNGAPVAEAEDMVGTCVLSARGELRAMTLDFPRHPAGEPATVGLKAITSLLAGVGTALPEEPVGIGARWRVQRKTSSGRWQARSATDHVFELASFDGTTARVVSVTADRQREDLPSGARTSAELVSKETVIDLRFPVSTSAQETSRFHMTAPDGRTSTVTFAAQSQAR